MMKKFSLVLFAAALMAFTSCGKSTGSGSSSIDSLALADSLENVRAAEQARQDSIALADSLRQDSIAKADKIIAFIKGIHTYKGRSEIFEDSWVNKHCTKKMIKYLRSHYDYEGPGYASWEIGGWVAAEDLETSLASVTYDGQYAYAYLKASGYCAKFIKDKRVIRYDVAVVNDVVVIDAVKWVKDFTIPSSYFESY